MTFNSSGKINVRPLLTQERFLHTIILFYKDPWPRRLEFSSVTPPKVDIRSARYPNEFVGPSSNKFLRDLPEY